MSTSTASEMGLQPGTWSIDPVHSEAGFTVRHLMSKVRGRFTDFTGEIVTKDNLEDSSVSVTIVSTPSRPTTNSATRTWALPTSSIRRRARNSPSPPLRSARAKTDTSSRGT